MCAEKSNRASFKNELYATLLSSMRERREADRITNFKTESPEEEILRKRGDADRRQWIENNLYIRTKRKQVVKLVFNTIQARYWEDRSARDVILKFRQPGISTLVLADFFEDTIHSSNTTTAILAHDATSTNNLFQTILFFYKNLSDEVKIRLNGADKNGKPNRPKYGNKKELFFENINCRIVVGTAGSVDFGRSWTLNNVLLSEIAMYDDPETLLTGLLNSVPYDGRIVAESTANGFNYFETVYSDAKALKVRWKAHFYRWFEHSEYQLPLYPGEEINLTEKESDLVSKFGLSLSQIKWRRDKITEAPRKPGRTKEEIFLQEYPEDDLSCFISSGRPVFNREIILTVKRRLESENVIPFDYRINSLAMVGGAAVLPLPGGELKVWKKPEPGKHYIIGADTAEGIENECDSTANILEYWSGDQVAELRGKFEPNNFGKMLSRLGWFYNIAGIAVERNNHGHSVLNTLINYEFYPIKSIYHHLEYDQEKGEESARPGYPTTATTKPILLADMMDALENGTVRINSLELLDQMFYYMLDAKGKAIPAPGKYSDLIIAIMIALQAKKVMVPGSGARMIKVS